MHLYNVTVWQIAGSQTRYHFQSSSSSSSLKIHEPSLSSSSSFLILRVQIRVPQLLPNLCQVQVVFIGFSVSSSKIVKFKIGSKLNKLFSRPSSVMFFKSDKKDGVRNPGE